MEIMESWQDEKGNHFAIGRYSEEERKEFNCKQHYEALWMEDDELNSFAGVPGFNIARFDTVEEAQDFLLKGMAEEDTNPDIWLDMLEV